MLGHRGPDVSGLAQLAPERLWLAAVAVAVQEVTPPVPAEQGADSLAQQAVLVTPGGGGGRHPAPPPTRRGCAAQCFSRRARRNSLPTAVFGTSSTSSKWMGFL